MKKEAPERATEVAARYRSYTAWVHCGQTHGCRIPLIVIPIPSFGLWVGFGTWSIRKYTFLSPP